MEKKRIHPLLEAALRDPAVRSKFTAEDVKRIGIITGMSAAELISEFVKCEQ